MPVSWEVGVRLNAKLDNTMLDRAISTLPSDVHQIIHSDRKCHHYRWPGWIDRTYEQGSTHKINQEGGPGQRDPRGILRMNEERDVLQAQLAGCNGYKIYQSG